MTFQAFLEKNNGKWIEVSGSSAQNQCVDLANAYIRDVLGLPIIEWTNAKDFPSKAGDKYDYILNTLTNIPQEGDLMIFDGIYGHISIFIEGNVDSFRSFDQNYPTGSNSHVQNHNYNNPKVLNWLRAKKQYDYGSELNKCVLERDRNWNYLISIADLLQKETNIDIIKEEIKKLIAYEDKVIEKEKQLTEANNEIEKLKKELNDLKVINEEIKVLNDELGVRVEEFKVKSDNQETSIGIMEQKIAQLEASTSESGLSGIALIIRGIKKLFKGGV